MKPRRTSWHLGLGAGAAAALVGLLFLILPFTWGLSHLSYELPFLVRPNQPIQDVVIVYMDEHSDERLGTGRSYRWDRSLHARLLQVLKLAGTRAVAFDLVFNYPGTNAAQAAADAQLVAAAREHGKVAVGARPGPAIGPEGTSLGMTLMKPLPALAEVAAWGMAEGADDTGTIREHAWDSGFEIPSLAWRVAELTRTQLPADPFASRWINYYGPAGHLPHIPYADVLEPGFPAAATFSNKVVFVGASYVIGFTGGPGTDYYRTPHTLITGLKMPGVEICATAYLNLARGDWLNRLSPPVESGSIALFGLAIGMGLTRLRPGRSALVAFTAMLLLPALAVALTWSTRCWFPWLVVTGIQIPIALSVAVLRHTLQLQRDKRALEQSLALTRAGAVPGDERRKDQPQPPLPDAEPDRVEARSPVGIGSSARPSGPSAAVNDLLLASPLQPGQPPSVPEHHLLRRIGRGAYGEVWIGRDIIGSYHAVKLVFRDAFKEAEPFDREFKGLSRFTPISRSHPGLVHVLQVGRNDAAGYLYYVMELADDVTQGTLIQPDTYTPRTLSSLLRDRQRLPIVDCLDLAMRLCEALEFLHCHNLIHRDIKPSNVIFVNGAPKFADIGLVTDVAATDHDVSYLGTKGYIAPEGPGTPAADVYSLGKVIYQMGFGLDVARFPELPTSVVIDPDESALFGLNHVVMRACEASAAARYQTAAELGAALANLRRQFASPAEKPRDGSK